MLTSEVMFELELRRAQRFDLLIGEKGGWRKWTKNNFFFFFRKKNQTILTKIKRLA